MIRLASAVFPDRVPTVPAPKKWVWGLLGVALMVAAVARAFGPPPPAPAPLEAYPDLLQQRMNAEFEKPKFNFTLVRVENNGGGVVDEFRALVDRWSASGARVEIKGTCKSACTLFTAVPNVCVMKGAELWFHAPFVMPQNGVRQYDPRITYDMLNDYPTAVQKWIEGKGGLTPDWIVLKGKALTHLIPSCD